MNPNNQKSGNENGNSQPEQDNRNRTVAPPPPLPQLQQLQQLQQQQQHRIPHIQYMGPQQQMSFPQQMAQYQQALLRRPQNIRQRQIVQNNQAFTRPNPPPPPLQNTRPNEGSRVIFSADQSFQMLSQLMAFGYIEKRDELPNMVIMVLQHFENLRRLKLERQQPQYRQNYRHNLANVYGPAYQRNNQQNNQRNI